MSKPSKKQKLDPLVENNMDDKKKGPRVIKPEFNEADQLAHSIQENLLASYIGTVRMYRKHLTSEWETTTLAANRKLVSSATNVLVDEFETRGLKRDLMEHHMSATMPGQYIQTLAEAFGLPNIEGLKDKSAKGDYPLVTSAVNSTLHKEWKGSKPILQGGQHRFAALEQFLATEDERWWPVRLYNADIIGPTSLGHLRSNASVTHTALSDGRRFLLCYDFQQQIDGYERRGINRLKPDEYQKYEDLCNAQKLEESRYVSGSKKRHEQIWARPELRDALAKIMIAIPEMTPLFKLPALNDLLSCRCQKVHEYL